MHFAKRHELGVGILQAAGLGLLIAFIYRYFGPSSTTAPTLEELGGLTMGAVLLMAAANHGIRAWTRPAAETTAAPAAARQEQARQLNELLQKADWVQLEKVVTGIYARLGCAASRRSNMERENNFSLIIERAGKKTAVMCKPWKSAEVASPEIIEFSTELRQAGLSHGVLVTLRECTLPALSVASNLGVEIVNREGLVDLFGACVEESRAELLTNLGDGRKQCPSCASEMEVRTATKGLGAGEEFWGCTAFPKCRCTEPR